MQRISSIIRMGGAFCMLVVFELLAAVLAAIGAVTCVWLLLGWLLRPRKPKTPLCAVVRARTPEELQRGVGWFLWLRKWDALDWRVLVLEETLDEEAKRVARKLMENEPGLLVGERADVEKLLG